MIALGLGSAGARGARDDRMRSNITTDFVSTTV